jgi:hypothetical protein
MDKKKEKKEKVYKIEDELTKESETDTSGDHPDPKKEEK